MLSGGIISCAAGLNLNGGSIIGTGTIDGNVTNNSGTVAPGLSPGRININGSYTQSASGTLEIEIAGLTTPGVDYDLLEVSGAATLGGTIHISDINGFILSGTDTVTPLTAGSVVGTFSTTNAQCTYGSTSVVVRRCLRRRQQQHLSLLQHQRRHQRRRQHRLQPRPRTDQHIWHYLLLLESSSWPSAKCDAHPNW